MAAKKGNGHDPTTARMVELLQQIAEDIRGVREEARATNARIDGLREEVGGLRAEVTGLRGEVEGLRGETRTALIGIDEELHELRAEMREQRDVGELKERVTRIEAQLAARPS